MRPRFLISIACLVAAMPGFAWGEGSPSKTSKALAAVAKPPSKVASRAPPAKRTATGPSAAARAWHEAPQGATAPLDSAGRPMLTLQGLNIPDRVTLAARSDRGGFSAEDLDRAAHVLRDQRTGNEHPVEPQLLDFVYRIAVHFSAPEVRILSGYRTPRAGTHSNHGKGRAIDLVVPNVADEEVARFARDQGFCGVGVYPTSGFVHLDVRERSFFWVDYSGPGQRNRTRGILGELAAQSDARALSRGEKRIDPFGIATDVDAALARLTHDQAAASSATPLEDDDIDESSGDP